MTSCHSYYGNMYGILPKTIYSLEKIKVKPTPIWIWNKYKGYKETNVMNGIKHIREHLQYNEMGWNIKNIVFDQGQLFDSCLYGPTLSQSFTFTPKFWIRPFFLTYTKMLWTHSTCSSHSIFFTNTIFLTHIKILWTEPTNATHTKILSTPTTNPSYLANFFWLR